MLSKRERIAAKLEAVRQGIEELIPSERASKVKIDVRSHKGGFTKVWIRSTLKKTRTSEGAGEIAP